MMRSILWCLTLVLSVPSSLSAARCDTDAVPAATLLFPYFEVDLDRPNEKTTLLSITNREPEPVLARVVLWTDWAVPTLGFEVYLAGHDLQTLNLRDVFVQGALPQTGPAVSPHGELSGAPVAFPGCNATAEPGAAPVYPSPAISGAALEQLRAFHTGECFQGARAGAYSPKDNLARGYVTVDVVNRCSSLTPADEGYFAAGGLGVASDRNALSGDFFFVDAGEGFAQGETAVHVEAFPGELAAGDYTFYRRYVAGSASDDREPLGTQYAVRHILGGAFDAGTRLLVWRDTGTPDAEPISCDTRFPAWARPFGLESLRVLLDEDGNREAFSDSCVILPPCTDYPLTRATQSVGYFHDQPEPNFDLARPYVFPFGQTILVLRRAFANVSPESWPVLQGWVSVVHSAEGRFSVGQRAVRLDSACAPGPIAPVPARF